MTVANVITAMAGVTKSPPLTIPALLIATGANINPIIIIIGPTTTGGNNFSSHPLPTLFIMSPTIT